MGRSADARGAGRAHSTGAGSSCSAWTMCTARAGTASISIPARRAWRHLAVRRATCTTRCCRSPQSRNPNPFVIATGASFGAYHAACFGFRHPDLVNRIIGMSGLYDMKRLTGGYSDDNVYACNPSTSCCTSGTRRGSRRFRRQDIILAIGRDDPSCENNRRLSAAAVGQGDRQRPADLGRLGPRLAVLGTDDPSCTSAGTTERRSAAHDHKRIGLMVGREWSFPPAFIEEVNRRDAGRDRRVRQARRAEHGRGPPYDVIIDRISHEVPFYRSYLKHAVLQGVTVVNNPFMWTRRRQVLRRLAGHASSASRTRRRSCCPTRSTSRASSTTRACATSQYPLDWQAIVDYIGLPCILKDAHGGGWKDVYVCHSLEELIHHYDHVRPADDGRAGVHHVGPVRPLHVPRARTRSCR